MCVVFTLLFNIQFFMCAINVFTTMVQITTYLCAKQIYLQQWFKLQLTCIYLHIKCIYNNCSNYNLRVFICTSNVFTTIVQITTYLSAQKMCLQQCFKLQLVFILYNTFRIPRMLEFICVIIWDLHSRKVVSIRKTGRLRLYREAVTVYCNSYAKRIIALCVDRVQSR